MKFRLLLGICAMGAGIPALSAPLPAAANTPPAPAAATRDAARDYVRFQGDNIRGKLETVIVTLKNAAGVKVDLIGAVHIADAAYYATLMRIFAGYEALLFELVDGQRLRESVEAPPKPRRPATGAPFRPDSAAPPRDEA